MVFNDNVIRMNYIFEPTRFILDMKADEKHKNGCRNWSQSDCNRIPSLRFIPHILVEHARAAALEENKRKKLLSPALTATGNRTFLRCASITPAASN